jgi:hypothetical protein
MSADHLLLWMSASGTGTWERYCAAVEEIWCAVPAGSAVVPGRLSLHQRLRMNFERMAHAEFFTQGRTEWRVVPPTLVQIFSPGKAKAVLCGARTRRLLAAITAAVGSLPLEKSTIEEAPERIEVSANSRRELQELAARAGVRIEIEASRKLLAALPHVDDREAMHPTELPTGADHTVHRFSCLDLAWTAIEAAAAQASRFGLFRYASFRGPIFYWKQGSKTFRLPGQVGKFIALKQARQKVFRYDEGSMTALLPVSCRPPMLIERALILSSGRPPEFSGGELRYSNIPAELAATSRDLMRQ